MKSADSRRNPKIGAKKGGFSERIGMMSEMEVDEVGGQPQKSHDRNEEEGGGGSEMKKIKTDPPSTNDDSTDPRLASGWTPIPLSNFPLYKNMEGGGGERGIWWIDRDVVEVVRDLLKVVRSACLDPCDPLGIDQEWRKRILAARRAMFLRVDEITNVDEFPYPIDDKNDKLVDMEVDEGGGQPHKCLERNKVGGSEREKFKTDLLSTNHYYTDPRLALIDDKIDKLVEKGWRGIYFSSWNRENFKYYGQFRVDFDSRGFPIRMINYPCQEESETHEADIQYLKLLKAMVDSQEITVSDPYSVLYGYVRGLKSSFDLVQIEDINDIIEDFTYIYGFVESIEQWKLMFKYLSHADDVIKNECSNDTKSLVIRLRKMFPFASVTQPAISMIAEMWITGQQDWVEIVKTCENQFVSSLEKSFSCRLQYGYTKADYLKLKLEVARKVGIITEKFDDSFIPCHPELPDVD